MNVNVLGTEYTVKLDVARRDDKYLEELDGYTDETSRTIVVSDCKSTNYDNPQEYKDRVLLHEVIHSFLNESGLPKGTCDWHCEEMVEWMAMQMPKIVAAYEYLVKPKETEESRYINKKHPTVIERQKG